MKKKKPKQMTFAEFSKFNGRNVSGVYANKWRYRRPTGDRGVDLDPSGQLWIWSDSDYVRTRPGRKAKV